MTRIHFIIAAGALILSMTPASVTAQTNAKPVDAKANTAASSNAKVDQSTLELGLTDFGNRQYVEAEKLLRAARIAIDAGTIKPQGNLSRCLDRLSAIYRAWGRYDDALEIALRYRKYVFSISALDAATRNDLLDKNATDLADILTALDRPKEADAYLQQVLSQAQKQNNPTRTLNVLVKIGRVAEAQGDNAKAGNAWTQVIALGLQTAGKLEPQLPKSKSEYTDCMVDLAAAYAAGNHLPEASAVYQRLLGKQQAPVDAEAAIQSRINLASIYAETGQHQQALKVFGEALDAQRKLDTDPGQEAELLSRMAAIYKALGNDTEAGRKWEQASIIYSKAINRAENSGDAQGQLMGLLDQLQKVEQQAGHYQVAIQVCTRLLDLRKTMLGDQHPFTTSAKSDLGALYGASQNYEKARPLLTEVVKYWEKHVPPAPLQWSRALNDLAFVEREVGSYDQAQDLFEKSLKLRTENLHSDDTRLAQTCGNLATVFLDKGEYARAIVLFDQAAEIYRSHGPLAQESLSRTLLNEARVYRSQGQLAKAVSTCEESLNIDQKAAGKDAPSTIDHLNTLAAICLAQGSQSKLSEAADYSGRAWQLCQNNRLEHEPIAGDTLYQKARVEYQQKQSKEAQSDWHDALDIQKKHGQTAQAARTLNYLANLASQDKTEDAKKLYTQALELQGTAIAHPETYYLSACNLAQILFDEGKTKQAIKLAESAVQALETPRAGTVGGETERAEYYAEFASAFDQLVKWNLDQKDVDKAFEYAERGRNRTFLDQLSLVGVDLRDTASRDLREKEQALRTKFASLQAEARVAQPGEASNALIQQLTKTQQEYAQVITDIHSASPYYREQLSHEGQFSSLEALRRRLAKLNSLMLFYYAGAKQTYLLVIDPASKETKVFPLEIPAQLAGAMKVNAGPITRSSLVQLVFQYLADVRDHDGGRGLAGTVISPKGVLAADQGTALAEVLVPREVRTIVEQRKAQGKAKSVIIVPDGALNELPFEALLLERQSNEKNLYLLDVFPPTAYAPSANILMNLIGRPPDAKAVATLTVGNPKYPDAPAVPVAQRSVADVTRAAYLGLLGGGLPPLAATVEECKRIVRAFQGSKINDLEAEQATEGKLRANLPGCRFIHVAAHGLVDQQNENLFGAIALTPPATPSDSTDDGFLSVNEIFNLPLSGCELVALSACQTNVGPDRPLEAGSTIAQAFLAAGARRAVCSHWNVDDKSTAELMGTFFEQIAQSAKPGAGGGQGLIEYAKALHDAQLRVRNDKENSKWSSPYYWAPFVLIGPPQ